METWSWGSQFVVSFYHLLVLMFDPKVPKEGSAWVLLLSSHQKSPSQGSG